MARNAESVLYVGGVEAEFIGEKAKLMAIAELIDKSELVKITKRQWSQTARSPGGLSKLAISLLWEGEP